jgi:hypothetical protein
MAKRKLDTRRIYFVYKLIRPWNGRVCYYGKGCGKRHLRHAAQHAVRGHYNPYLRNIFNKAGGNLPAIIIRNGLTEVEAFEIEIALIAAIGRADKGLGPLANMTDGGDGSSDLARTGGHALMRKLDRETRIEKARRAGLDPKNKVSKQNIRWITNGSITKMVKRTDPIPKDWRMGRASTDRLHYHAIALGQAHINTRWINDGTKNKQLKPNLRLPKGWTFGRIMPTGLLPAARTVAIGRRWITDDKTDKMMPSGGKIPKGWRYGRTNFPRTLPRKFKETR